MTKPIKKCKVAGCSNASRAIGYCSTHYYRIHKYGTTNAQALKRKAISTIVILPKSLVRKGYCRVENCTNKNHAGGFCAKHYTYLKNRNISMPQIKATMKNKEKKCIIDGCIRAAYAKGFCELHYRRRKRSNDPLVVKITPRKNHKNMYKVPTKVIAKNKCSAQGCTKMAVIGKHYCSNHILGVKHLERKFTIIKLLGGKCIQCGYNKSLNALDLHHVTPHDKKYNISELIMQNYPDSDILEREVKKCVVLCANCHRKLHDMYAQFTKEDLGWPTPKSKI